MKILVAEDDIVLPPFARSSVAKVGIQCSQLLGWS